MPIRFLLVCGLLVSAGAWADASPTFDSLVQKVEAKDSTIRSAGDLVCSLPSEYRSNYVALFDSLSLQAATFRAPRVVLFGKTAKLVLAFSGHPGVSGRRVEAMEFNDKAKRFEFHEIEFAANGGKPIIRRNDPKCLNCHGRTPLPLWDSYSVWPGAYGSSDDHITEFPHESRFHSTKEGKEHDRFVDERLEQKKEDRGAYRCLEEQGGDLPGYSEYTVRPNLKLNMLLDPMRKQVLTRVITEDPNLAPLRFAIAAALDRCDLAPFFPLARRDELHKTIASLEVEITDVNRASSRAKYDRYRAITGDSLEAEGTVVPGENEAAGRYLAELKFIVDGFSNRHIDEWTMSVTSPSYDFGHQRGLEEWKKMIAGSVVRNAPRLGCQDLLKAHLEQFRPTASSEARVETAIERFKRRGWKLESRINPFRRCVQCHLAGSERGAPVIPFENLSLLEARFRADPSLVDNVAVRLTAHGASPMAMPPNGPLSSVEREAITDWTALRLGRRITPR